VVAYGRNSLLVYFGCHLMMIVMLQHGRPTWAVQAAANVDFTGHPHLSWVLVMLAGWTALAAVLHRRHLYMKP
jgi:hypothetical protein